MSERKVLNKYYPPDFDPSKIPRMKLPKNRKFSVRLMAPCNMRCTTCGEYIYKGKKFNARKEDVENEDYLGIRIYRFYIKCTRCLSEIAFKTDPRNTDYVIEAGATRNFQALKLAEEAAEREEQERIEEEKSNPMKLLENRTKASKQEMEMLESLEELKELNQRQATINYEDMLDRYKDNLEKQRIAREQEEDERLIHSIFGKSEGAVIKRLLSDDDSDEEPIKRTYSTVELASNNESHSNLPKDEEVPVWEKSVGKINTKLSGLVKAKTTCKPEVKVASSSALTLLSNYSDSE